MNVPKGIRGHRPELTHPDVIPVPTHVWCDQLGRQVPIMPNNLKQRAASIGMMVRMTTGSTVYGTNSGKSSDIDEFGVAIESAHNVLGGQHSFEQYTFRTAEFGKTLDKGEHPRSGVGDLDLSVFSLRKFVRLATQGNPSVLLNLYTPPEHVLYKTELGQELLDHRDWFVSTKAANPFMGYLTAQRDGLMGKRSGGARNKGRADIRAEFGYDVKFSMHMVRLGLQGVEYLTTGAMSLPIAEPNLSYLRDIRAGKYSLQHCLDHADHLVEEIKKLRDDNSNIPHDANFDAIDNWLVETHRRHWRWEHRK